MKDKNWVGEQPRVETRQEKDERHKHVLFKGLPMPSGWEMPHLIEPPDFSRPDAQQRAARQIESLKKAEFESWRQVPFDVGIAVEPGKSGRWGEMTEYAKLEILQHWIDWEGVCLKDRATLVAASIDVEKLPSKVRTLLLEDAGVLSPGKDVERDGPEL